jgi:hypothetical protein
MATNCPICNKDDGIQKLSVIVSSGKSSGTYSGPSGGSTISDLALRLAPPPEPKQTPGKPWRLQTIAIVIVLLLGCPLLIGAVLKIWGLAIAALIGLILVVTFVAVTVSNRRKMTEANYKNEKPLWDIAIGKWNRLYFCHRDGIVFDPGTQETCQPDNLTKFIYS